MTQDTTIKLSRRKIIFVSQDYSWAPLIAVEEAKRFSRFVMDKGYIPLSPVLLFHGVGDNHKEYDKILTMCRRLIDVSAEVWEFGPATPRGTGRSIERGYAKSINIPVHDKEKEFQDWFDRHF